MNIKKAQFSDLESLAEVYPQLSGKDSDMSKLKSTFEKLDQDDKYSLLVALDETNRVIGSAMGILCYDLVGSCDPFMLIENVIVLDNCRGKGVGEKLMEALEEIAKENHCSYIILVSGAQRTGAHAFYNRVGYKEEKGFKKKIQL